MGFDTILHIMFGGLITAFLFAIGMPSIFVLFFISMIAGAKEFIDHFFVLGHCYPLCMDEHESDFLFSLVGFFVFVPIFAFARLREVALESRHIALIWFVVTTTHLAANYYYQSNDSNLTSRAQMTLCQVDSAPAR